MGKPPFCAARCHCDFTGMAGTIKMRITENWLNLCMFQYNIYIYMDIYIYIYIYIRIYIWICIYIYIYTYGDIVYKPSCNIKKSNHSPYRKKHNIIVDSMKTAQAYHWPFSTVDCPERKRPVPVPMRCRAAWQRDWRAIFEPTGGCIGHFFLFWTHDLLKYGIYWF